MENRIFIHHPPRRQRTQLRLLIAGVSVVVIGIALVQIRLTLAQNEFDALKDDFSITRSRVVEGASEVVSIEAIDSVQSALENVNAAIEQQQMIDGVVDAVNADISTGTQSPVEDVVPIDSEIPTTP